MALFGAPTSRDHIPDLLEMNLRKAYLDMYSRLPAFYTRIYNIETSNKKIERDALVAGYGTYPVKAEGDDPVFDSGQEAFPQSYTHKSYALGVQVTREALMDDIHGVIRWLTQTGGGLAQVAKYTKEVNAMDLFNSLLTSGTVYTAGGTNYSLASTTHFRVDGGVIANTPTNPIDLSIEALEFLISFWMVNNVNQRGQLLGTQPEWIMVGPSDGPLAKRLIKSIARPQGNDNDPNVVRDVIQDCMVTPFLTNDGRWAAFGPKNLTGLNYFERYAPNVEKWAATTNGNLQLVGFYRESHGASHIENVFASS